MEMSDELVKRIADLERELAELKQRLAPKEPYVPKEWPRFDPTESMRMPASAVKPMADLIHGKGAKYDPDAWARTRRSEPGGFGSPAEPSGARREPEERGPGWNDPMKLEGPIKGRWSE
jgi:hypothetical protein